MLAGCRTTSSPFERTDELVAVSTCDARGARLVLTRLVAPQWCHDPLVE